MATGSTKTKGNVCTPRPVGCSAIASTAERRSEAALPPVSDSLSAIGGPGFATFKNRIRLEKLSKYIGGGTCGTVYETTGTLLSANGGPATMQVAVKVLHKLTWTPEGAVEYNKDVANEIQILTSLAETAGVVQLRSWSEGLTDVHLVFDKFPGTLHDYIHRGDHGSRRANVRSICQQFVLALKHVHAKQIIHRDLKPGNVLVHDVSVGAGLSAVGDIKKPSIVLADFGGACQLEVGADDYASFSLIDIAREATTYQYRAPEVFVHQKIRANSYATDVWAFGVCIAELAIGMKPFGSSNMTYYQTIEDAFDKLLNVLYGANSKALNVDVRQDASTFFEHLKTLKMLEVRSLPWRAVTDADVTNLLRKCFVAHPPSRPTAKQLAHQI